MKRYIAATGLLLLLWMGGCSIKQDYSLCAADDNVVLLFTMRATAEGEFLENIHNVDVILFDHNYNYVLDRRVTGEELASFEGVRLTVEPGTYHVVCWANVTENSAFSELTSDSNFENSHIEITSSETGCPIYYAPYKTPVAHPGAKGWTRADDDYSLYSVEVLPARETVKELDFARVHRTVQVYIKNYENTDHYDGQCPVVKKVNTYGRYDFLLRADLTNPITLERASEFKTVGEQDLHHTEIHSALVPIDENMEVSLFHPTTGAQLASVNLAQYVAENDVDDDSEIPILFDFTDSDVGAAVTVGMPDWGEIEVKPIGNK